MTGNWLVDEKLDTFCIVEHLITVLMTRLKHVLLQTGLVLLGKLCMIVNCSAGPCISDR